MRRKKTLRISAELFAQFLKEPIPPGITQTGVPGDMEIDSAWFEMPNMVVLLVSSVEFAEDGGDLVPLFHQSRPTLESPVLKPEDI